MVRQQEDVGGNTSGEVTKETEVWGDKLNVL
jgi:hypothetical protein